MISSEDKPTVYSQAYPAIWVIPDQSSILRL